MLTETQLKERLGYIGASEAAAVLGMSRWATPLEIWATKTGQIPPKDLSDHLPVILGNRLEEVVAELFTAKTGKKLRRVNETFYHPKHDFLACNIDRRVTGEDTIFEAKTASAYKSKEWVNEEIPREYLIQVQQMLSVTGYSKAYLAVLIGNSDFLIKEIHRDQELITQMTKKLVHFWTEYVVPKQMPDFISSNDSETLQDLFQTDTGPEIELGDDVDILIESRSAMIADLKSLEASLEKTNNELKSKLGSSGVARTSKNIISWKAQSQKRLDMDAIKQAHPDIIEKYLTDRSMRVLRVKPIKEIT